MIDTVTTKTLFIIGSLTSPVDATNNEYITYTDKPITAQAQTYQADKNEQFFLEINTIVDNFDKTEGELISYKNFTEKWDGYDSIAPDKDIIEGALKLLKSIKYLNLPAPQPMLTSEGEVSLYWNSGNTYIETCFDEKNLFSYLIDSPKDTIGEDDIFFNGDNNILPKDLLSALLKSKKFIASGTDPEQLFFQTASNDDKTYFKKVI